MRIVIADDNDEMRRRIRSLVESQESWTVCGEASTGRQALELVERIEPHVAIIDLSMPELNGLEVTRRITDEWPAVDVLVMSVHRSDELAREAIRAGAKAIIDKSLAYERLKPAIKSLHRTIHLGGCVVGDVRHIGAFFQSAEEAQRVLGPFVCDGFVQGERAVHVIDAEHEAEHMQMLRNCGIDPEQARAARQLAILDWKTAYLHDGRFDMFGMIDRIQELLLEGPREGFPKARFIANMGWAKTNAPGCRDVAEYETRVDYVLPKFDDAVTCVYDLSRFDAAEVDAVMRAHPGLLIGNDFCVNPDYVPPDELLPQLKQRSH